MIVLPVWPLKDARFRYLVLECPKCQNQWRFEANSASGNLRYLTWICSGCGNYESLQLKCLLEFGKLGLHFPKGGKDLDHQWDTVRILPN